MKFRSTVKSNRPRIDITMELSDVGSNSSTLHKFRVSTYDEKNWTYIFRKAKTHKFFIVYL